MSFWYLQFFQKKKILFPLNSSFLPKYKFWNFLTFNIDNINSLHLQKHLIRRALFPQTKSQPQTPQLKALFIWCFFFLFRWMRIPQLLPSAGSSTIVSISKNSMRSVSLQITSYLRSTLPQQQIKITALCFVWGKTLLVIRTSHAPSKLYLLVSNYRWLNIRWHF